MGEQVNPEITMRMNMDAVSRLGQINVYRYIKQKEIEVKNVFLSGMKGVKSVKSVRKTTYNYHSRD